MRESTLHGIAIAVVAVALGSAVIITDAVAAEGHAGGGMGDGHFGGAMGRGGFGGGFRPGGFEQGHRGLAVPFGYYDGYGDYGSYSNNGCRSLDGYGCEE